MIVGLTGGIASGKSLVGAMFVKLGAGLVDTDVIAREVVARGEPGHAAVSAAFGPGILLASGEINRGALRSVVFGDHAKRAELEAIAASADPRPHAAEARGARSAVCDRRGAAARRNQLSPSSWIEFSSSTAPRSAQLERLMRRDAIPRDEALAMVRAQVDRATRLKAAHDVIDNSGTPEATRRQVEHLHHRYRDLAAQRAR